LNTIQHATTFVITIAYRQYTLYRRGVSAALAAIVLLILVGASAGPSQAGSQNVHDANTAMLYPVHVRHLQHTNRPAAFPAASLAASAHSLAATCPSWYIMATKNTPGTSSILTASSALSADDIWAVGYSLAGNRATTMIQHWNGSEWSIVPAPNPFPEDNYLEAVVAVAANNVWAVGRGGPSKETQTFALHWDGGSWSRAPLPGIVGGLYGVAALSANDIWAVGYRGDVNRPQSLIMHFDGQQWRQVSSPETDVEILFAVSAYAANNVWVVGTSANGLGIQTLVKRWDGKEWSENLYHAVQPQRRRNVLYGVVVLSPDNVWAVGASNNQAIIEHWDGSTWDRVHEIDGIGNDQFLTGIAAVTPDNIWAVGYARKIGPDRDIAIIAHWDGTAWAAVPSADSGEGKVLSGVSIIPGGDVLAVGTANGATLAERYGDRCASPTAVPSPTIVGTPVPATPTTPPTVPTVPAVPIPGTGSRTFSETGKTASGLFLEYWDTHGGLAQQGYPISNVFGEVSDLNGQPYTVQYFERAVFEYHPENQPPFNVLLSQLGTFQYKRKYNTGAPNQQPNTSAGSVLFPETGKRVGGKFLAYWQDHGSLAQQGLPISEEFVEKSDLDGKDYLVQYFERAVFEYHPENQPPYDVLLSQLGTFQYKQKYGNR
jgi:hypothetical protein